MVLEIEYYKADTQLVGKTRNYLELKEQLDKVEELHDRKADNFVDLLCRMFGFEELNSFERPDYVYDRDIQKLI